MYFIENILLYFGGMVMVTKEGSNKIVNFMIPRAGVLVLWRVHIINIVKMHYFFTNLLLYSQV